MPDTAGRFLQIAKASVRSSDPPLEIHNLAGSVRFLGDSAWLDMPHFDLPASTGGAKGKVFWGGPQPTRYAMHIIGDSVSLNDVAWVYPTLPRTGGGRLEVDMNNVRHPQIMDYALTRMDVSSTRSRLVGSMTYGVGDPVLAVKDVQHRGAAAEFRSAASVERKEISVRLAGRHHGHRARAGRSAQSFPR